MVDKEFCMSSFLAFRYIIDDNKNFYENINHQIYKIIPKEKRILVKNEKDIDEVLSSQFKTVKGKKIGILLSGGMDSACLASYMAGCDAYTFRFLQGNNQKDELKRAEYYANKYHLKLHYVDISWNTVHNNLEELMKKKGAPVHSIEPQILAAVTQAKNDGIELMFIGDAADYVFGGMDGLYAKDWKFNEFIDRYTYVNPQEVLINPVDMIDAFEKYRKGEYIDYIGFMHEYTDIESYASYSNAFKTGQMSYIDPYEILEMASPLDIQRIRNGDSKYLIRALFRMKYPEIPVPQKLPMPRPVDDYFRTWKGPKRPEFCKNISIKKYSGNQKWLIYCLERFLDMNEPI